MKKRKQRSARVKSAPPKSAAPQARSHQVTTIPKSRSWFRVAKSVWGPVFGLPPVLVTLSAFFGPVWPTQPDIHPAGSDPGAPFSLPFSVVNKSVVFGYKNFRGSCILISVKTLNGIVLSNDVIEAGPERDVPPSGVTNVSCAVSVPANIVASATMKIAVSYKITFFGFSVQRSYTTDAFNWARTTTGGMWIEGPLR